MAEKMSSGTRKVMLAAQGREKEPDCESFCDKGEDNEKNSCERDYQKYKRDVY